MAASKDVKTAHSLLEKKRTSDVLSSENANVDFASLMLSPPVQKGLTSAGFERPSPIQLKAIPLGRCGLDLIVQAKSGTGKTCVFSVIALESIIASSNSLQILVLAPTREIAIQIQNVIQAIGCAIEGLKCHAFIGGTIFGQDRQNLKKCHIAVGTPGRIKQLIEYDVMKTDSVRLFILDEADKLLDDKFQASVNWIYHQLPENKQMLALSATYPESLAQQLTNYMRDPTFVRLNPRDLTLQGIKQFYKIVPGHELPHKAFQVKADHLVDLLSQIAFNQCLIFSNLQSRAQNLSDVLLERGWPVTFISGNQEQEDRLKAMAELKDYKCRILISTDLTARGIDAENVNLIINLDVPKDFKTYLHRIGRAGRFGTHGAAITFASEGSEVNLLQTVQKKSGSNIKMLPDLLPSNLLELTFHEVETEILTPESEPVNSDSGDIIELISSSKSNLIGSKHLEDTSGHEALVLTNNDDKDAKIGSPNFEKSKPEGSYEGRESSEVVLQDEKQEQAESQQSLFTSNKDEDDIYREIDSLQERNPLWSIRNELQDWMVPMAIVQQVRHTTRQPWQWDDVVRLFEDRKCGSEEEIGSKSTEEMRGLKYNSVGEIMKYDEDNGERSVRSSQVSGPGYMEATSGCEKLSSEMISQEAGRSNAENINEFGHQEDGDILVEFKAVRDLLEKFKMEEAVLDERDSSQSLRRDDDYVDQIPLDLDQQKFKACAETFQFNGYSYIHVKRTTEVPDWQNGKEITEREGCKQDLCITDKRDHGEDTLSNNSRAAKRSLSSKRDVTGNSSFSKEGKSTNERQSSLMKNGRRQKVKNVSDSEGNTRSFNDIKAYKDCSDEAAPRMRLQDDQTSGEQSIHQNTSTKSHAKWFQIPAQQCTSSDNVWEYFKFVARTNSQKMFALQGENSSEQGKEDITQIQKERNSVGKVENDLKFFTINEQEGNETMNTNSEQFSESMEESHDHLTSDYFQEYDQFTETGHCGASMDQYRYGYLFNDSGNRLERSSVRSKVNSAPEFGDTNEDVLDPHKVDAEEGAHLQYWMGNSSGAEGWGNCYGPSSILWDGQTTYCNEQFNTPYYYESFYPYI